MLTGSWLLYWFAINPWSDESMTVSIRKSFMWTANKEGNVEANMEAIFAAMITTSAVVKIRPEEIQACTGFETRRHFLYKYVSFIWYSKYRSKVNRKGKSILFALCRGKGCREPRPFSFTSWMYFWITMNGTFFVMHRSIWKYDPTLLISVAELFTLQTCLSYFCNIWSVMMKESLKV